MSILYDEGQVAIATESRRVLDATLKKDRLLSLIECTGAYDEDFWQIAVEQGWTSLAIPEEFGGLGLGLVELGLVAQAAGAGPAGAPFLTFSYGFAQAIIKAKQQALAQEYLPKLATGEVRGTIAFGEAHSPLPDKPLVRFRQGQLDGAKVAVPAALHSSVAVVWAEGEDGPVLALADLTGVDCNAVQSYDNSRLYADLNFSRTPAILLAQGSEAQRIAREVLAQMAVVTAHEQVGGAETLLFAARDYALTRKAFGQPIGAFQSIKHRIAEVYGLLEIARANAIHAAACDGGSDFLIAAADARISATEAYDAASRDCIQIHGGIGVTWESGLHLHMRRARSLAVECGNLVFWEDLLVDELTGEKA